MIECISYLWKHISVFKYIDINALIKQEYSGWTNEDRLGWGWTRRGAAHLEEPAEVVAHGPEVGDVLQRGSQLQRDSLRGNWPQRGLHGPGCATPGPVPAPAGRPPGQPPPPGPAVSPPSRPGSVRPRRRAAFRLVANARRGRGLARGATPPGPRLTPPCRTVSLPRRNLLPSYRSPTPT